MKLLNWLFAIVIIFFSYHIYAQCGGYSKKIIKNNYVVKINIEKGEACSEGTYSLSIKPPHKKITNMTLEREGAVNHVWVEKLEHDKYFSVLVEIQSAGSGSYGELNLYRANKNGVYAQEKLTEMSFKGYQGHDTYNVENGKITRSFNIYKENDANCCPTGGTAIFNYDFKNNKWVIAKN
jgi:hypothetical protein